MCNIDQHVSALQSKYPRICIIAQCNILKYKAVTPLIYKLYSSITIGLIDLLMQYQQKKMAEWSRVLLTLQDKD